MNSTCPSEERLKSLICEAFDELSGADTVRLRQIGIDTGKLARCHKPSRSSMRHWIFWLLFGASMAAAAWWGSEALLVGKPATPTAPAQPVMPEPAVSNGTKSSASSEKQGADLKATIEQQDSPVIYQREQY